MGTHRHVLSPELHILLRNIPDLIVGENARARSLAAAPSLWFRLL